MRQKKIEGKEECYLHSSISPTHSQKIALTAYDVVLSKNSMGVSKENKEWQ